MSIIFGSYQEAIQALQDVIGGINEHSAASPYHAADNDKMIAGIQCGISEIERRLNAEISATLEYYNPNDCGLEIYDKDKEINDNFNEEI